MLWLICQITVRQLVTPAPLMGRVNATVQTAIYGVRRWVRWRAASWRPTPACRAPCC
jgi:hypothetical protein